MLMFYLQMIETPEERSKFEKLYIEYRGLMYHVAYDILKNNEDAEDVVHQAFVSVAENMKCVEDPESPRTKGYLVTIVENKAINLYNFSKRFGSLSDGEDEVMGLDFEFDGGSTLAQCLAQLPARYREFIFLKYQLGFETSEVARMMQITQANASKIDQRAKKKLEALCKGVGIL